MEVYMELKNRAKVIFDTGFNIAFRSKLVSVPVIGSYMDVVYTESIQAIKETAFQNSIEKKEEKKVDKEYLNSLEFFNLLVKTFKLTLDEIETDKVIYFSKLIKDSLESDELGRKYNFDYIKTISELSVDQMCILKVLYVQQKDIVSYSGDNFGNVILTKTDYKNISKILEDKYSITNDEFEFLAKRTEATGLIHEILYLDDDGNMGYVYAINSTLIKLMGKLDIE